MKILNLTQHAASPDQVAAGVVEPTDKAPVRRLLTFEGSAPTTAEILRRAEQLARMAREAEVSAAMIGGAGFLMGPLELALSRAGIRPLHSFTERVATETLQSDGSVLKAQVFRHLGWIESATVPSAQGFRSGDLGC